MIVTIASLIVIFLETILCKFFLDIFFGKPDRKKLYICLPILYVINLFGAVFLSYIFPLKMLEVIIGGIIIWKICYKSPWIKTCMLYVSYVAIQLVSDYGIMIILYNFFPEVISNTVTNDIVGVMAALFSKTVVFIVILALREAVKKNKKMLVLQDLKIMIFPIVTVLLMTVVISNWYIVESRDQAKVLMVISLVIIVMNLIIFIWSDGGMGLSDYDARCEMASAQQKAAIHEFKNLLAVIYQLAEENDTKQLKSLIKDNRKWLSEKVDRITTKNPILDIILNDKIEEMENLNIAHMITISEITRLPVSETDFIVLISNILNNAIEAAQKCEDPFISIRCSEDEHNFIFYAENTISQVPLMENGMFVSTKEDKTNHGKGISNIKNIVEKYHGEYDIDIAGETFGFSIMFYLDRK